MDRNIPRGYVLFSTKARRYPLSGFKPHTLILALFIEVTLVLGVLFAVGLAPAQAQQNGEIEWIRQFGSPSGDWAIRISQHSSGVYVFGDTDGALQGQDSAGGQDVYVRKYRPNGKEVWTRQFGTASRDQAFGISVDSTGIYVVGYTDGTLPGQTSAGPRDAFVRKYKLNGQEVWTRQFGTSTGSVASAIAVGSTGVYVAGSAGGALPGQPSEDGNLFVRKYDANGNEIWTRQFDADSLSGISVDPSGVYVAGITGGAFPGQTNEGGQDGFVRKYDANGYEIWTRQFGTSFLDKASAISVDSTGVYVAGTTGGSLPGQTSEGSDDAFVLKYDADGNEIWTRQFGTASRDHAIGISVSDGGVYVAGETEGTLPGQTSAGDYDAFVRKYDVDGAEVWTLQFGSSPEGSALGDDFVEGISAGDKGVYVAGGTDGTLSVQTSVGDYDAFVVKLSKSGTVTPPDTGTGETAWTRQFGTSAADVALGISVDSSGVYVAGYTLGTFPGQTDTASGDAFVRKYSSDGSEVWTRQFGSFSFADQALGISVNASGVYVGGFTLGTLPGQTNSGGGDAFVRKYDADGSEVWTRQFGTASADKVLGISVDASGVYVGGFTLGTFPDLTPSASKDAFVRKYDTNGNHLWTRQFGSSSLADEVLGISVDSSGVYLAGYTFGPSPAESKDAFVAKYDFDGTEIWTQQFGSLSLADEAVGISVDSSGAYVAVQTIDDFVRKYDLDGNELWTNQLADEARAISVDSSGVYVTGGGAFVLKYDASGKEVWTRQFVAEPLAISVHSSGVYVSGAMSGDAFVAKLPLTGTMHVASIDISFLTEGRKVQAVAQVMMLDEKGFPVPGATVTGDWFLNGKLVNEATFGTTGSDGIVTISSGRINRAKSGDTIGFCVTGATGSHNYIASGNVETCDATPKP